MIIKPTKILGKARDLTLIAIICHERNFTDIVRAFEFADGKHKRYTLFKRISHFEQIRGQRWDGYIKMWTSHDSIEREVDQVIQELQTRGVKELKVNRTSKGPIIELPKQSQVNS